MADLNMADGLARLLRLVPGITLDNRAIKLLSEGKMNQVMAEFNGTWEEQFKDKKAVDELEEVKEEAKEEKPKKIKKKRSVKSLLGKNDKGIDDKKD